MEFNLISRFSYKYRNYISDCGRFLIEVKEAINLDSSDHLNLFNIRVVDTKTQRSKVLKYKARNYILHEMLTFVANNLTIENGIFII